MSRFLIHRHILFVATISLSCVTPLASAEGIKSIAEFERSVDTPIDQLELALPALTMEELEKEVEIWGNMVVEKSREIAQQQIAQKRTDGDGKPEDAKGASLENITKLNEQRTALVDRFEMILDAYESRGGDVEQWESYLASWSGLKVDVTDASAAYTIAIGWLKSKEGGIRWAKNAAMFIITLLIFWILSGIAGRMVLKALSYTKQPSELLRNFLVSLTKRAVLLIGLVVALTALEVPVAPFIAVIGAAGLVIGLALQGTLSNFASGILILIYKPYDVGDGVNVAGVSGSVKSMNLISTTIHTFDNQKVIVPNNSIFSGNITNVTGNPTRRVDMTFGIGYGDDFDKARDVLMKIVESHELVLKDPAPVIKIHELADSSVNFIVRPWAKTSDYWAVYWDITREVKKQFDSERISIPFPQRDLHVYQQEVSSS